MNTIGVSHVCGRLESRYRYSKDVVYNNFPWPEVVSSVSRRRVEIAAQNILSVRAAHQGASLADLYDPRSMPPDLVKAHGELDRAVDACYGHQFADKEERIEFLFNLYRKYTSKNSDADLEIPSDDYRLAA